MENGSVFFVFTRLLPVFVSLFFFLCYLFLSETPSFQQKIWKILLMAIFFFSFVIFPFFLIKIWYTVISAFGIIVEFSTVAVETVEKIAPFEKPMPLGKISLQNRNFNRLPAKQLKKMWKKRNALQQQYRKAQPPSKGGINT